MPKLERPKAKKNARTREPEQKQTEDAVEAPRAPDLLGGLALEVWDILTESLRRRQAYHESDRLTIGRYCWYLSRWMVLAKVVEDGTEFEVRKRKDGGEYRGLRPEVRQLSGYEANLVRLEKLLGITPGARARIKELLEGGGKSELDEFVNRKGVGRPPHAPQ